VLGLELGLVLHDKSSIIMTFYAMSRIVVVSGFYRATLC